MNTVLSRSRITLLHRSRLTLLAVLLAGCSVEGYCLDCIDGGPVDGGTDARVDANWPDAWRVWDSGVPVETDGCMPFAVELCNGADEDCDGEVDEGIDLASDEENCGECGLRCAPPHAFGECTEGTCEVTSCDVGFRDLDGDPDNGCEYRCLEIAENDVVCDLSDDDCDGRVDEDVTFDVDPENCGSCARVCAFPHGEGGCAAAACVLAECHAGFHDIDGAEHNGCEYACTPASPALETCNLRDDDCDGLIDEGDPEGGGACGSDVGACAMGVERCEAGAIVCTGATVPDTETCDGTDQDCDGSVDEGNPDGGRLCGSGTGACEPGREACMGGALVCVGAIGPVAETCNGLDDDCDGVIDEGNPDGGGACGNDTGACMAGAYACRGGVRVCEGAVGATSETCNGVDDDCDGSVDEGDPEGGGSCGTDVGECTPGVRHCTGGTLTCSGGTSALPERCNGLDDDCDGGVDEGDPEGGASCGTDTGACVAGTVRCAGGALSCQGASGPQLEVCNTIDDDCDGTVDEGTLLATDPRNCGMCGRVCSYPNGIPVCAGGACMLAGCVTGHHDRDGDPANGCEYACELAGAEVCNGRDDDCDGSIDEGLTPPPSYCNPNGVCGGTTATCGGSVGWKCLYPSTYESVETRCDGLDNDCDGGVDEPFPLVGTSCTNGELGACLRTGAYACTSAGTGVQCSAMPSGGGSAEQCNGLDDDCDGAMDESAPVAWVPFSGSFGSRWIMAYEASRPDATATSEGGMTHRVCSQAGRLPWTNVNYATAQAACATVGGRLCTEAEWERACEASSGSCDWSFASSCTSYSSNVTTCNGNDYDPSPAPGDQDITLATGSRASCYASWGGSSRIYDMSGNVEEWTAARASGVNPLRGGSSNDTAGGMRCDFDFVVANDTFQVPTVGFRCCRSSAP